MSMAYVRKTYGIKVKRGDHVKVDGYHGTVTRATHYVFIRIAGLPHSRPYHPTDPRIEYATRESKQ